MKRTNHDTNGLRCLKVQMRKKIYDQMATKTMGKKKEHIMLNVMFLDLGLSSFFFLVLTKKRKKEKKKRTHYAK